MFDLKYHLKVVSYDIPKLSRSDKSIMKNAIEEKLMTEPEVFGVPLRKSLKGYRKLRVVNYRIIFRIQNTTIKIFAIQHRSVAYERINKRIK